MRRAQALCGTKKITLATHNLKRRPIRTGLSILGIGLAVGGALALISLSHSIQDSAREGMDEMGDDLVVMRKGASDVFGGFIPEQTVELVAATPGVTRVSGERARPFIRSVSGDSLNWSAFGSSIRTRQDAAQNRLIATSMLPRVALE
jgi:hypothetical protein